MEDKSLFGVPISFNELGMISVSDLQEAYNVAKKSHGWSDRRVDSVMQTDSFKRLIFLALSDKGLVDQDLDSFYLVVGRSGMIKVLKSLDLYKTVGRGSSRKVYCVEWVWKILYEFLFKEHSTINIPKFILDMGASGYTSLTRNRRSESREGLFISKFLKSSDLISKNACVQYEDGGFFYDLRIDLLGTPFIIEYHEAQHRFKKNRNNDLLKFINVRDRFAYLVIPSGKESEQLDFLLECLSGKYDIDFINELEVLRFDISNEPMNKAINSIITQPNYPEIAKKINIKVFGQHINGMRNLASSKELRKISDIERQVISAIEMGWIKTEEDLYKFLDR